MNTMKNPILLDVQKLYDEHVNFGIPIGAGGRLISCSDTFPLYWLLIDAASEKAYRRGFFKAYAQIHHLIDSQYDYKKMYDWRYYGIPYSKQHDIICLNDDVRNQFRQLHIFDNMHVKNSNASDIAQLYFDTIKQFVTIDYALALHNKLSSRFSMTLSELGMQKYGARIEKHYRKGFFHGADQLIKTKCSRIMRWVNATYCFYSACPPYISNYFEPPPCLTLYRMLRSY